MSQAGGGCIAALLHDAGQGQPGFPAPGMGGGGPVAAGVEQGIANVEAQLGRRGGGGQGVAIGGDGLGQAAGLAMRLGGSRVVLPAHGGGKSISAASRLI